MQKTTSNIEMLRVKALSILCTTHHAHDFSSFSPIPDKVHPCCSTKNQVNHDEFLDLDDSTPVQEKLDPYFITNQQTHDNDEEIVEEREFSFACTEVQGADVFADEIFENGKIRPIHHTFDQSLLFFPTSNNNALHLRAPLKKIFLNDSTNPLSRSGGISKQLQNEPLHNMTLVEMKVSNECYEKSNSTGSSKLRRFPKNLNLRSNSDLKDSFVLMNPSVLKKPSKPNIENTVAKKRKNEKHNNALSAYEKFYLTNKTRKDSNKQRSFLPYKHQLFGFFTNMNGLSRNVHPY